jgi:hypothetical protein
MGIGTRLELGQIRSEPGIFGMLIRHKEKGDLMIPEQPRNLSDGFV